jgi:hypothetical protein
MTVRLLGATAPERPSAEARTIVGNPASPAIAAGIVFRKSLRRILASFLVMFSPAF